MNSNVNLKYKRKIRNKGFNYLNKFGDNIKTKFNNICGKTGSYNVPEELFQKRTKRNNRVLISWRSVVKNNLEWEHLLTFEGGVTVDFVNNDYFNENDNSKLKERLKQNLGSDNTVSAIISIKSEDGSSSSKVQREAFERLCDSQNKYLYKGNYINITKQNYRDYAISQVKTGGSGNEKWKGFLYVSIQGGQQDTLKSHEDNITIFNPACEYASEDIMLDIDLCMIYFALYSIDVKKLSLNLRHEFYELLEEVKDILKNSVYDNDSYSGSVLAYCENHPCLKFGYGKELYDPIQIEKITIEDFTIKDKKELNNLDFTHNEAVTYEKFYWDKRKKCVLSPARPDNIFWSRHLSNMIQQDFTLNEFFDQEEQRVEKRKEFMKQ